MKQPISGRAWAYVGVAVGGAVSVAANIAHSYVPPTGAGATWSPRAGAVIGAVFWPVALFVAVEILARIPWPAGRRWAFLRFGGLMPVAVVAAVVSYRHLSGLLDFYGEDGLTVAFGPLAVDGLMIVSTAALLATGGRRAATRPAAAPRPATMPVPKVAAEPAEKPVPKVAAEPAEKPVPAPREKSAGKPAATGGLAAVTATALPAGSRGPRDQRTRDALDLVAGGLTVAEACERTGAAVRTVESWAPKIRKSATETNGHNVLAEVTGGQS